MCFTLTLKTALRTPTLNCLGTSWETRPETSERRQTEDKTGDKRKTRPWRRTQHPRLKNKLADWEDKLGDKTKTRPGNRTQHPMADTLKTALRTPTVKLSRQKTIIWAFTRLGPSLNESFLCAFALPEMLDARWVWPPYYDLNITDVYHPQLPQWWRSLAVDLSDSQNSVDLMMYFPTPCYQKN